MKESHSGTAELTQPGSGQMFDKIAHRYDLLNRLMSFGLDVSWRRKLVRATIEGCQAGDQVLDVATGTADVAIEIARQRADVQVVGLDPSRNMLDVGERKLAAKSLRSQVSLQLGDGQALPFDANTFGGACISFGIRNVPDRTQGLREMARVVRPGGRVAVLELSEPPSSGLGIFARIYVHHIVPTLGAILSGASEYRYLQKSIAAFPPAPEFKALMEDAGLGDVTYRGLMAGVAHIYCGRVR